MNRDYLSKIKTNFLKIPFSILSNIILPRLLGVNNYGVFEFLVSTNQKFLSFFDLGTLTAFYVEYSKKKERGLIFFYIRYLIIVYIFLNILILGLYNSDIFDSIWFDNSIYLVLSSFNFTYLLYIINFIIRVYDGSNKTKKGESLRSFFVVLNFLVYLFLFLFFDNIELIQFILTITFFQLINILLYIFILFNPKFDIEIFKFNGFKYVKYMWNYSSPLILYFLISTSFGFFERWFLQLNNGNIDQAYFGFSWKISSIISLISGAFVPIFTRELSRFKKVNIKLIDLYKKSFVNSYIFSAFCASIIAFNSEIFVLFFGGNEFMGSSIVLSILCFYPLHQIVGQVNGSLFYASSRTKIYSVNGIFFSILGFILVFILVDSKFLFSFSLGAKGLAVAIILNQIISTNSLTYLNCKYMNISYLYFLKIQALYFFVFFIISFLCNEFIKNLIKIDDILLSSLLSILLYLVASILVIKLINKDLFNSVRNVTKNYRY